MHIAHCTSRRIFQTDTLWLFNIAMENGPFIDDFPMKTSIYKGFSMAMLNNQMVYTSKREVSKSSKSEPDSLAKSAGQIIKSHQAKSMRFQPSSPPQRLEIFLENA